MFLEIDKITASFISTAAVFLTVCFSAPAQPSLVPPLPLPEPTVSNIPEDPSIMESTRQTPATPQSNPAALITSDTENIPNPVGDSNASAIEDANVETTLFDIYLGDKFEGSILADYTDNWLKVSEPQAVIDQMSDVKEGHLFLPLITERIEKRRELPKVGSVHYDLNTFRLIFETAPEFLGVSNLDLKRISPDPNAGFSLQQRLGITESGSLQGSSRNALTHRGIASLGSLFSIIDGTLIDRDRYELSEASAGGIVGDYRANAGLLQTIGSIFAPSLQFTGINMQTADELFLDQDLIRGSSFQVFIPSRSKVEFFKDGRLLAVQVLDFGLREINTSAFPQGSYDVDIVMTDSFGRVSRERKFFTKAGYLTSKDQPSYSLQLGNIRDGVTLLDTPVYQGGVRWRASDFFDLSGSVYGSDNLNITTVETNGLYRDIRFGFGGSTSSKNDTGVTGSLGVTVLGTNFNTSIAKTLRGGTKPPILPTPSPDDPFGPIFNLRNRDTTLSFQDRTSISHSVSHTLGPVDLRYESSRSSGDGSPTRKSAGPVIEWRLSENSISTLKLQAARLDTDRGRIVSTGLVYSYRLSPEWVLNAQLAHRRESELGEDSAFFLTLNYDDKVAEDPGTRIAVNDEIRSRKPKKGDSVTSFNNQLDIDHTSNYLQTIGFVRDSRTSKENNTSVGVSAASSFLVSSDGSLSLSHPVGEEAIFIADLSSKTTDSEFEVLLDNQIMAKVKAGRKAVIGVTPYRRYSVKIRPLQNADLVNYDSSSSTITFFPGNVMTRKWQIDKVYIVLGRLVDMQGNPLVRQRIKGTREYTATEDDGTFQAELGGSETLTVENAAYKCTLNLKIPNRPEFYVDLGDVSCLPQN